MTRKLFASKNEPKLTGLVWFDSDGDNTINTKIFTDNEENSKVSACNPMCDYIDWKLLWYFYYLVLGT